MSGFFDLARALSGGAKAGGQDVYAQERLRLAQMNSYQSDADLKQEQRRTAMAEAGQKRQEQADIKRREDFFNATGFPQYGIMPGDSRLPALAAAAARGKGEDFKNTVSGFGDMQNQNWKAQAVDRIPKPAPNIGEQAARAGLDGAMFSQAFPTPPPKHIAPADLSAYNLLLNAAGGKPIEAVDIKGDTTFDPFGLTGVAPAPTAIGGSVIRENDAQAGQAQASAALDYVKQGESRANAAQSYAAADSSRASAAYTRARTARLDPLPAVAPLGAATGPGAPRPPPGGYSGKPMSAPLQKAEADDIAAVQTARNLEADAKDLRAQIGSGQVRIGPVANTVNRGRNAVGRGTPESARLSVLDQRLTRFVNDSLRLNKGVQTEGDAQRAAAEIAKNRNDPLALQANLDELARVNALARRNRGELIDNRRAQNRQPPSQFGASAAPAPTRSLPPGWSRR